MTFENKQMPRPLSSTNEDSCLYAIFMDLRSYDGSNALSQYAEGAFNNHVDIFLPFVNHPPTPSGQAWTFGLPPTPCPRGHLENDHPLIRPIQYAPHFAQTKVGIKEISFLCNIYLPKLGLDSLGKE